MESRFNILQLARALLAVRFLLGQALATETEPLIRVGDTFRYGNHQARLVSLDSLPLVENEYSRRYRFDSSENPKLRELRDRYHLQALIAGGRDEFQQQVLLNDWVHRQFLKFGTPSTNCHGALRILNAIREGQTFYCSHYAETLVSAAASLGWIDRPLALRRHQGVARVGGSTEHSVTEMWSNQFGKWVMFDPTSNLHVERDALPLNAFEIRQEWFYHHGTNLVFVVGREQRRYQKKDLPIVLGQFAGFGELAFHPDEPDKYGFIGYIPNTDLMNSGYDYAGMFIVKDSLCDGTPWHTRKNPADPATDPYFPINQAAIQLTTHQEGVQISLRTQTPNLREFQVRFEDGDWRATAAVLAWPLKPGKCRLEARTINQFGVSGPISRAEIVVTP